MKMDLRNRALVAVTATSVVLVALLYAVLSRVVERGFANVEQDHAELEVQRAREAFAFQVQTVCERGGDWAYWDDAYRYLGGENASFAAENLETINFDGMNVDFLLFLDPKGAIVASTGRTPSGGTGKAPSALVDAHFRPGSPVSRGLGKPEARSGVLLTAGLPPALFCAFPVLTSDLKGPSRGALVMGRFFNDARRAQLAQQAKLDVSFAAPGDPDYGGDFAAALGLLPATDSIALDQRSADILRGFTRFPDFSGNQSLVARVHIPRAVHQRALASLRFLLGALVLYGLALAAISVVLVETSVIRILRGKASELFAATVQLSTTAESSAATANQQATMVAEVSATVEELNETSRSAAGHAKTVLEAAGAALAVTRDGEVAMGAALHVMDQIADAVSVVDSVNSLTEQSNLLAVNASIEAARAGDQGRGFAAVAVEVRNLAEQSRSATQRISDAIQRTEQGRAAIRLAVGVVQRLTGVLEETTDRSRQIVAATGQQASGIEQISEAMVAVARGGHDTAAAARQIHGAVSSLERAGRALVGFVGRESTGGGHAPEGAE
jgi:sensor domain CHASE-containing protein